MATFATKFRVVTAAAAVAAATTLLPMPAAQAETSAPAPAAPVVTLATPSAPSTTPGIGNKLDINAPQTLGNFGCGPLGFICVGPEGSAPPGQVIITIPFLGWFLGSITVCSLGYSAKQGPYGSLVISRSRRC